MNRLRGLTIATESKLLALTKGYFPEEEKKKSYCIHTDIKELREHMQRHQSNILTDDKRYK